MALDHLFKLAKLTIKAFSDVQRQTPIADKPEFEVMFNPSSFSMRYGNVFQSQQGINTSASQARYAHGRSQTLSLALIVDGTGVCDFGIEVLLGTGGKSVADQVKHFLTTCFDKNGDIHEPNYLKLQWGKGVLQEGFDCRLQTVNINYTSFDRDGAPLRAELDTTFIQDVDPERLSAEERPSSPDLSHLRVVKSGDTLPLLCREIYGSAKHYIRVAQVNHLDDFRNLRPGQELLFPPFERGSKG